MDLFSDDYYQSYKNFVQAIEDDPKDLQLIYDHLDELVKDYPQILELSAIELFHDLYAVSPLAAVALFGHSGTRAHYLMDKEDRELFRQLEESEFSTFSEEISSDFFKKLGVASQMSHFMCFSSFPEELGEDNYRICDRMLMCGRPFRSGKIAMLRCGQILHRTNCSII